MQRGGTAKRWPGCNGPSSFVRTSHRRPCCWDSIAFEEGDVALAIKTYEDALKHAPDDPVLRSTLNGWKRETDAHRTFEEARYDRFRVMFEGRAEQSLATQATGILNSAFWRIGEKLGSYPATTIVAVLYTEQQFRDITRAPDWSGGQYDGRIRIPAAGASRNPELFERILVHELTHAVLDAIVGRRVPTWLNEGLAQYFDGSDPEEARRRLKAVGRNDSSQGARARLWSPERASGAGRVRREPARHARHARSTRIRVARAPEPVGRRPVVR